MPEQSPPVAGVVSWALAGIATLIASVTSWMFRRQVDRIDTLESTAVTKDEFNTASERLEKRLDDLRGDNQATHRRIDGVHKILIDMAGKD